MKKVLVTGSSGLIGSEVVRLFDGLGWSVTGVDNNMRQVFFGPEGDTSWNQRRLSETCERFTHHALDVRDRQGVRELFNTLRPDLVVHAAAQPSHDRAAAIPFEDFEVNALGTLNLLESLRHEAPEAVFVFLSTNKVYGDRPNSIDLDELETRWDYADPSYRDGIDERMSIDRSKHSLFGVSKAAADLLVQEYGRYFGLNTICLRAGCLTGPAHSGVQLHGFLSYLVRCNLEEREYTVFGYKGKQVRDNIHAHDVATCIEQLYHHPASGAVFNLGGGRAGSVSILEAFDRVSQLSGKPMRHTYDETAREGDHICYISDTSALRAHIPQWGIARNLEAIFDEVVAEWQSRLS